MKKNAEVLVLDFHRGIYFGRIQKTENAGRTVHLKRARHCFYYPITEAGHRGVYGLATVGPGAGAKVGPEVSMIVHDVAKVVECTPAAVAKWDSATW